MKKSLPFGVIIVLLILVVDVQTSYSQCSVNYVYPNYFSFTGNFDVGYATVSTYPEYCTPSISCSSWLSMYPQDGDTYIIICEQNTGTSRYGYINVGDAYISVYQEASLPLDPGSISITNTNICYNSSPGTINNSESASGGGCSTYSYSWSKSTNGTSFSSITGATGLTYNPGTMTISQYFRRTVMCDGIYAYTSPVYIEITPQLFPGSISDNQSIPYNTAPSTLTNYSSPSGGTGSYSYQWQISTDNNNWADITGATYSSYSPGVLTSSKYYRRNVFSGPCGPVSSSSILIDVNFANPSANQNYVYVQEFNKEVDSISKFNSLYYADIIHNIQYLDGRGRLLQTNIVEGSPNRKDIITPVYYDEFGRESVKYLPYTLQSNYGSYIDTAISNQYHFYQNANLYPGDTANSKIIYEKSPLNRILEQGAPGRPWQPYDVSDNYSGHTVKFDYMSNSEHEVLLWRISGDTLINSGGDSYNLFNFYPENTLYKIITKDENWDQSSNQLNTNEEFQDKMGNTVLKRKFVESGASVDTLDTYYIYDDFNLLRFVLTPKAVVSITGSMDQLLPSDNIIKGLCYYYKYDKRKRLIVKQIPGVDPIYMIYDKRDRLVLTQDGNLRKDLTENELRKWSFIKYDRLNRPVLTGILTYGSVQNQEQMQTVVDSLYSGASPREYYIDRNSLLTTTLGYTDGSFPKSTDGSMEYLTATYYDDYNFPDKKTFSTTVLTPYKLDRFIQRV